MVFVIRIAVRFAPPKCLAAEASHSQLPGPNTLLRTSLRRLSLAAFAFHLLDVGDRKVAESWAARRIAVALALSPRHHWTSRLSS